MCKYGDYTYGYNRLGGKMLFIGDMQCFALVIYNFCEIGDIQAVGLVIYNASH